MIALILRTVLFLLLFMVLTVTPAVIPDVPECDDKSPIRICGSSTRILYKCTVQRCINGQVEDLESPAPPSDVTYQTATAAEYIITSTNTHVPLVATKVPSTTAKSLPSTIKTDPINHSTAPTKNCRRIKCHHNSVVCADKFRDTVCGKKGGYNPDFQTCCRDWNGAEVHDQSKESAHACCGKHLFPRNGNIPCNHPSRNDPLWRAKVKTELPNEVRQFVYVVKPNYTEIKCIDGFTAYPADIEILHNGTSIDQKYHLLFDKYSRSKRAASRQSRFVVLSNYDQRTSYDFLVRADDIIVRFKSSLPKSVRKWLKEKAFWTQKNNFFTLFASRVRH